jgi:hypothetical protein
MLLTVLIIAAAVIGVFLAVVASRAGEFRVARSTTIAAPAEIVFDQVNILRQWEAWNPWGKVDPNAKMTYAGPAAGVGASYDWEGNSKVGAGRNTIIESQAPRLIRFRLEFRRPMKGTNLAEFTFDPQGGATKVTWTMTGRINFAGKMFSLFIDCEKMCGDQFDQGLAAMKSVAESKAALAVAAN